MQETKDELLRGKSTIIKNTQFLDASSYADPFFKRMDLLGARYIIRVKKADQLSVTKQVPDIVYNRVHIQAILPDSYYLKNNCNKCIGFIYGLDTKSPVAKFYIADIDKSDLTLFIFDSQCIDTQEIEDSTPLNYSVIDNLLKIADTNSISIQQLINTPYIDKDLLVNKLGPWIATTLNCSIISGNNLVKLATTVPINAFKNLTINKDSKFFVSGSVIQLIEVYKALFNSLEEDKDIVNSVDKAILINKLLLC